MSQILRKSTWLISTAILLFLVPSAQADSSQLIKSTNGSGNLYEKLIVKSSSAVYVKEPTVGSTRIFVPAFSIFYRLKTDTPNNEQEGYYRIGKRNGESIGWIKKEFVAAWNTRFGLEPGLPQPDRHFTIYRDEKGESAHIEFVGKEGQIPDGAKRFALITDVPAEENGDEVYPVVVFTGSVESGGAREKEQMALYNLQLEVVFVIDTTASMEPLIEVARQVVKRTTDSLVNMPDVKPVVHFGLVEYRDAPPQAEFASRLLCRLNEDHGVFWQKLQDLKVSTADMNDIPEDMVAGLKLAINDVAWRPNSSKHIIILGDAPAKDGFDAISDETYRSDSGWTLDQVNQAARPQGGSDSERALGAKNFHSISNDHQPLLDTFMNAPEIKKLPVKEQRELREVLEDPQLTAEIRRDADAVFRSLQQSGMEADVADALVTLIATSDALDRWQVALHTQLKLLAGNGQQLQGYYAEVNTHKSDNAKENAIQGLTDILNKAYQSLATARDGKAVEAAGSFANGGSISRAIYQIAGTKGDAAGLQQVENGYATLRDENGRQVAHKRVMVFKTELMRLYSVLDSLHTTFQSKSNKADRQNVSDILDELKRAVASQVSGQQIDENVNLKDLITFDFPLKTPALEVSAQQLGVMTTPAFNNWLESLATARDRSKALVMGGNANWTTLNNEDDEQFTFLALSELP